MATRTVTATAGGAGAGNGILLRVLVLDQAAVAGTPQAAGQSGAAAHQAPFTTSATGSQVYGALLNESAAAAMTLDSGCTAIDNVLDVVNGVNYATFSSGPTGTPGTKTVGSAAAAGGGLAAVEILESGGSITVDASSPAVAETTALGTVTTAAFTPPNGTLLVAIVTANGGAGLADMTVTDTSGLTWVQQSYTGQPGQGYCGVWTAQIPASGVIIVSQWTGTWAAPDAGSAPYPSTMPAQVPVANTGAPGNWLIAICTWRQPYAGWGGTVSVADDVRNWWEPLGAPSGTSSAAGVTRCSVWVAPSPFPAGNLYVAPTAYCQSIAVIVLEVSGLSPWLALASLALGYGNQVFAPAPATLSLAAPASQALVITAAATDNNFDTVSVASGGWTALGPAVASNGADRLSDLTATAAYQVTTGATAATWTVSPSVLDIAVISVAIITQPAAPAVGGLPAPNLNFPYIKVYAGFGSGARTPWDQVSWTDLTARWLGMQGQRGQQYELDTIQAGVHNHRFLNQDGALTPGFSSSPYWPDVTVYTPLRIIAVWPPPPSTAARTYIVHRGLVERWPQSLTPALVQDCNAVSTDVWATLTTLMDTILREEMLQDQPWALWPCSDLAGASYAINYASTPAGPLMVAASRAGAGGATYSFGADPGAYLAGDPGGTVWSQQGLTTTETTQGYCLYYQDSNLPPLSGGVTVTGWFQVLTGGPNSDSILFILKNTSGALAQVYLGNPNGSNPGQIMLAVWDKSTKVRTNTVISSSNWIYSGGEQGNPFRIALNLTQATWQIIINGGTVTGASGICNLPGTWAWVEFAGIADRFYSGGCWNGLAGHLGIYAGLLPVHRHLNHYLAGLLAFGGTDTSMMRMERLLAGSLAGVPRYIGTTPDDVQGALDIQGQTTQQNLVNVAESDSGLMVCDAGGYLRYLSRRAGYNLPAWQTFGEDFSAAALNANPQFTPAVITPWTAVNGTVTSSTAIAGPYTYSALLTPSGGQPAATIQDTAVPVTAGLSYLMTAWVYSPLAWNQVTIGFNLQTAGGSTVTAVTQAAVLTAKTWTLIQATATVPYGELITQAQPVVGLAGTPGTGNLLYVQNAIATAWEAGYLPDIALDFDPSQIYNDVQLQQFAAPQAAGGANAGITVTIKDATSLNAYGDLDLQETVYLWQASSVTDLANYILYTSRQPLIRVSQMTLDAAANPALWPVVLGAEVGKVSTVNRRLYELLQMSLPGQVMSVAHDTGPGKWQTKLTIVTYTGTALMCDSPVYGQLNGSNRLPWLGAGGGWRAASPLPCHPRPLHVGRERPRARPRADPAQRCRQRGVAVREPAAVHRVRCCRPVDHEHHRHPGHARHDHHRLVAGIPRRHDDELVFPAARLVPGGIRRAGRRDRRDRHADLRDRVRVERRRAGDRERGPFADRIRVHRPPDRSETGPRRPDTRHRLRAGRNLPVQRRRAEHRGDRIEIPGAVLPVDRRGGRHHRPGGPVEPRMAGAPVIHHQRSPQREHQEHHRIPRIPAVPGIHVDRVAVDPQRHVHDRVDSHDGDRRHLFRVLDGHEHVHVPARRDLVHVRRRLLHRRRDHHRDRPCRAAPRDEQQLQRRVTHRNVGQLRGPRERVLHRLQPRPQLRCPAAAAPQPGRHGETQRLPARFRQQRADHRVHREQHHPPDRRVAGQLT